MMCDTCVYLVIYEGLRRHDAGGAHWQHALRSPQGGIARVNPCTLCFFLPYIVSYLVIYEGVTWGTSLIRKRPPPQDPPRTLGIGYGRVLGGCIFL